MKPMHLPVAFARLGTAVARLAVTLVAATWLVAGLASAQVKKDFIEDKDYCFRLKSPGSDWSLLDEKAVQRISPDAVAGAMSTGGVFGFVIVEPSLSTSLAQHADLVFSGMPVVDKVREGPVEIEFQKLKALRYQVTGKVGGAELRWDTVLVEREGFVYQITSGTFLSKAERVTASLTPFQRAVVFLEGKPRARVPSAVVEDKVDVGWEVRQGVFRSASCGITVEPKPSWRLCLGYELQRMNKSAHVGLLHTDPDVYVIVIPEHADESESAAFLESLVTPPSPELLQRCPSMRMPILGQPWELVPMDAESEGLEYLHGAKFSNGFVMQILTWYRQSDSARVRAILSEGLSSLRWQTPDERVELDARLAGAPDPQNVVALAACIRGGIVRDFARAFRWTKPAGMWRMSIADEAHEHNELCSLFFEDLATGLMGLVLVEDVGAFDLDTYTTVVSQQMFEDGAAGTRTPRKFGEADGFVTQGRLSHGIELDYSVATALTTRHAYQLLVWGTPKNMERAKSTVQAVLDGFHVLANPERSLVTTASGVRDERVGYEFSRPAKGWRRSPIPLDEMKGSGSGVMFTSDEGEIGVVAMWFEQPGTPDGLLAEFAPEFIRKQFASGKAGEAARVQMDHPPVESRDEIGGRPCRRLSWSRDDGGVDVLLFGRDRTSYMIIAAGPRKAKLLETAKASLKLLP